jgi:hypothetical protein
MLRTWLVKISPETGSPVGSTTLVPKGRTREIIGQTEGDALDTAEVAAAEIGGDPRASLPRERGRVRVGAWLAISMASPSV